MHHVVMYQSCGVVIRRQEIDEETVLVPPITFRPIARLRRQFAFSRAYCSHASDKGPL